MSRSLRRGAIAASALVISIGTLTACGAGNNAETSKINPDNARVSRGDIKIQNAVVIRPSEKGDEPAVISARIFNSGDSDQTLDSLSIASSPAAVQLSGPKGSGSITVPAGGSVMLGGKGNASAVIEDTNKTGTDGSAKVLDFKFSETGSVKLTTLVVSAAGYYTDFAGTPTPTPVAPSVTPEADASADAGTELEADADASADAGAVEEESTPVGAVSPSDASGN